MYFLPTWWTLGYVERPAYIRMFQGNTAVGFVKKFFCYILNSHLKARITRPGEEIKQDPARIQMLLMGKGCQCTAC